MACEISSSASSSHPPSAPARRRSSSWRCWPTRVGLDLVSFQDHPYQPRLLETWTLLSALSSRTAGIKLAPTWRTSRCARPRCSRGRRRARHAERRAGRAGRRRGRFLVRVAAMGGRRSRPAERRRRARRGDRRHARAVDTGAGRAPGGPATTGSTAPSRGRTAPPHRRLDRRLQAAYAPAHRPRRRRLAAQPPVPAAGRPRPRQRRNRRGRAGSGTRPGRDPPDAQPPADFGRGDPSGSPARTASTRSSSWPTTRARSSRSRSWRRRPRAAWREEAAVAAVAARGDADAARGQRRRGAPRGAGRHARPRPRDHAPRRRAARPRDHAHAQRRRAALGSDALGRVKAPAPRAGSRRDVYRPRARGGQAPD